MHDDDIAAVRRFNRFYTREIGLVGDGGSGSTFSLTEQRVLYELAHRTGAAAADLVAELGIDAGYLRAPAVSSARRAGEEICSLPRHEFWRQR